MNRDSSDLSSNVIRVYNVLSRVGHLNFVSYYPAYHTYLHYHILICIKIFQYSEFIHYLEKQMFSTKEMQRWLCLNKKILHKFMYL